MNGNTQFKYRWWGKGDIDASIGIFFDGFSKILTATGIMTVVFGMPAKVVIGKVVQVSAWRSFWETCGIFTRPGAWPTRKSGTM